MSKYKVITTSVGGGPGNKVYKLGETVTADNFGGKKQTESLVKTGFLKPFTKKDEEAEVKANKLEAKAKRERKEAEEAKVEAEKKRLESKEADEKAEKEKKEAEEAEAAAEKNQSK